jgi:hypothetical protein|tara:strand:- start:15947 stop:16225 length:279 start_codon:yes stop_codon:yes gene_type:complete
VSDKQTRKTRLYDREQVIVLKNPENPRRKGSNRAAIFETIRDGMTVDEFLELAGEWNGGTKDLQILAESGHVHIVPLIPNTPLNTLEEQAEI